MLPNASSPWLLPIKRLRRKIWDTKRNAAFFEHLNVKRIKVCFIRMDGTQVDALRVIEITSAAETKEDALHRLSMAIGQWIENTNEGRRAWVESSKDFNVGDLAGHLSRTGKATSALQRFLEKEGIARVRDLFVLTNAEQESYDRILVNMKEK